jgi:GH25 family lysozyme M1 (1,4-beta-N-acetylmuramidase)
MNFVSSLVRSAVGLPGYTLKPRPAFDFSHYETVPDWSRVKFPDGTCILITKATEGVGMVDPTFQKYFQEMGKLPYHRGAYHFFRPNNVAGQVELYCQMVVDAGWKPGDLLIFDEEYDPSQSTIKLSPVELGHQVWFWLREVERRLGQRPIIYWNRNFSSFMRDSAGAMPSWINDYYHWVGWYPFSAYVDRNAWVPASVMPYGVRPDRVVMWQYAVNWRLEGVPYDGVDVNTVSQAWLDTLQAPEPTPGGEVIYPTYAIVRHKSEVFPGWLDDDGLKYLPETIPVADRPNDDGKGAAIDVSEATFEYIKAISPSPEADAFARSVHSMWINTPYEPGTTPHAESIICSHNFVRLEEKVGSSYRVASFPNNQDWSLFNPATVNWYTRPDLFFKAQSANIEDKHYTVWKGIDVFLPLMHKVVRDPDGFDVGMTYIHERFLEVFPALPMELTITADVLNILTKYSTKSDVLGRFSKGDKTTLVEYHLRGNDVWGKVEHPQGGWGWICLLMGEVKGSVLYFTSWSLSTLPVLPPVPYLEPPIPGVPVPEPPPVPPAPAFQKYISKVEVTWVVDEDGTTELQVIE